MEGARSARPGDPVQISEELHSRGHPRPAFRILFRSARAADGGLVITELGEDDACGIEQRLYTRTTGRTLRQNRA
jgi:hypothetical protein